MTDPLPAAALVATVGLGLVAVAARDFLVSVLSLSGASVALAVYFYLAGAPVAAVFEAVVAAGLVTVLFLFVVSLTETDAAEAIEGAKLPVVGVALGLLAAVGAAVWAFLGAVAATGASDVAFAEALWTTRSVDLLAVTVLLFVGVLGVVRLTAERFEAGLDAAEPADAGDASGVAGGTGAATNGGETDGDAGGGDAEPTTGETDDGSTADETTVGADGDATEVDR
ncbi:MAG: NADH-quinone oxidoreductase subunit J [Haloarculaceae archaeon]